ncbi:MAG: NAD(P)-dependent oxidoreductase [Euryarchaeota archaeon]|nr:NAD(P)-dependent oxidoreductase [Euryarchaeota archaeon]|tara:strand:- start:13458 stop:14354 length:897 start_codon:yes stop_codon:yes gene_type:complete
MNILVIGSSGQLGSEFLSNEGYKDFSFFSPSSSDLDINDEEEINNYLVKNQIQIVINFAAYTNVDQAEDDYKKANNINYLSLKKIITYLNKNNIYLIHISTDYVFGKNQEGPFKEYDITSPINKYGISKELGEKEIINNLKKGLIIRTASLYGLFGSNFFKTFYNLLLDKKTISAISDQKISLTNSLDLVNFIYLFIRHYIDNSTQDLFNNVKIYHIVNKGFTNWYEVAKTIANEMELLDGSISYSVNEISSDEWKSKAIRPPDSRLVVSELILSSLDYDMPNWEDSLRKTVKLNYDK